MAESSINMKFTAQTADAQKRIAELEKEVSRLNKETKQTGSASSSAASGMEGMISKAATVAAGIAAATVAVKAFIAAAKECVEALKIQEQAETRLTAVLKATGNQIGMTVEDLKDLASATQNITRFGDEAVIEAEKVLIATQALNKDGLQRAIMDSADLAEAMGTDIVSAAQTMAHALQDPAEGLSRLRRQGIAFTDEEVAQVKALQDANDLYGAQAVVLDKIESRYKGVAKAVGDTPTGTLDKIKNVWGDIKEGLGGALVDALGPAINLVYQGLLKISEWVNRARASVRTEQEVNSLTYALQYGNSTDEFSDDLLYAAIDAYQRKIDSWNLRSNYAQSTYKAYIQTVQAELDRRAEERAAALDLTIPTATGTAAGGSALENQQDSISSLSAFLAKYGNESTGYKAAQYQAIIDEAETLRAQMKLDNGKFNKTTREEWGIETLDEFADMYNQLGEIIESTKEKKDKLFEVDEPAIRTMKDFLDDYGNLSKTAQAAAIDAKIAEAEQWKAAAEEGSQELSVIEEIIEALEKQKKALEEVAAVDDETTTEIKNNWSAIASYMSGTIGATADYFSQIWNQQADDLEKVLERDKAAGDISEQEEAERLKTINDLRRKSFNAEKANSITNAMINGALAVTKCLSELGPVAGPIAASLVTATTALQVATIANQQFTPMAKGGIVTQATPIIAGEAGPEAIIPLSGGRAQQYLGNAGNVTINITIEGNADEEVVFHAIERAQRTGYLPNWQYV